MIDHYFPTAIPSSLTSAAPGKFDGEPFRPKNCCIAPDNKSFGNLGLLFNK